MAYEYGTKFDLDPNIVADRIPRLSALISSEPEAAERVCHLYSSLVTHQVTEYLHQRLKTLLSDKMTVALGEKGAEALIGRLLPKEIYEKICWKKLESDWN